MRRGDYIRKNGDIKTEKDLDLYGVLAMKNIKKG